MRNWEEILQILKLHSKYHCQGYILIPKIETKTQSIEQKQVLRQTNAREFSLGDVEK